MPWTDEKRRAHRRRYAHEAREWRAALTPLDRQMVFLRDDSALARLMSKVEFVASGCWNWNGAVDKSGYGSFGTGGWRRFLVISAHRASYILHRGLIAEGLTLDHLCRNTLCVNPDHLEPVSQAENNRRAREARTRPPAGQ